MEIKNKKYNRRSIRLQRYDYSLPGAYFITICIHKQKMLLKIKDVQMMIRSVWSSLPDRFLSLKLDEFAIIPNHVHAILCINAVGADLVSARKKTRPMSLPQQLVVLFKRLNRLQLINIF